MVAGYMANSMAAPESGLGLDVTFTEAYLWEVCS